MVPWDNLIDSHGLPVFENSQPLHGQARNQLRREEALERLQPTRSLQKSICA
jgi:hypothetical protein